MNRLRLIPGLKSRTGHIQLLLACLPQLVILLFLVGVAFLNGIAYIRNYTDSTAYHIPMAVEIAKHGNPYYVDSTATFTSFWFPAGAETMSALLIALTKDIDGTNLTGPVFFTLFLLLAYKFAGLWTDDPRVRLLCTVVTGLSPILLAETRAFYIDIHFNFFIYLSLYLYCLSLLSEDSNYAYLGMAAAILTASIKYHGIVVCAILVPVGVYCVLKNKKVSLRWWGILILVLCTAFASGWYVRNLLSKGNPFYPLPLPLTFQRVLPTLGTPYQSIEDYPSLSPETRWPHPLIPRTISHYKFQPDMTDDAFGVIFPVSLVMLIVIGIQARRMPKVQYQVFVFLLATTVAIVAVLPFGFRIPRYVLFVPAVAALWPALMMACLSSKSLARWLVYAVVVILGVFYIQANLLVRGSEKTVFQNAVEMLRDHRRSDIVYFDFVEEGDLRIGYVGGQFAFIASLYDQKLSNQLIQLHYRDYLYDKGYEHEDPDEFVRYVQLLELDYICIFDDQAPGAGLLLAHFPEKTFVEDTFR
jgi:hypothetical protein